MPSSRAEIITPALERIERIKECRTVLDVGVGFGKWGALCREYLDVWKGRPTPAQWEVRIQGIEVFPGYRNPLWAIYDDVATNDALSFVRDSEASWDLILVMDVLEHLQVEDGAALLRALLARCGKLLMIATPVVVRPQGEIYGNPYERHVSAWSPSAFRHYCVELTGRAPEQTIHGKTALWCLEVS